MRLLKFKLLFTIITLACLSYGQRRIDSLQNVLESDLNDTVRVKTLYKLSYALHFEGEYEDAISNAEEALETAENLIKNKKYLSFAKTYQIKLNKLIGLNLEKTDRFAEAVNYYKSALKLAIEANSMPLQCSLMGYLSLFYYNTGDYPAALNYALLQLDLAKIIDDQDYIASAYNKIGITYKRQMMHDEALENLFKSEAIYAEMDATLYKANVQNNIGNVYFNMGNYNQAYHYYNLELQAGIEIDDNELVADAYNCTALIFNEIAFMQPDSIAQLLYGGQKDVGELTSSSMLDSARFYFNQAIAVYTDLHLYYELADCYNGLGQTYTIQGRSLEAILSFHTSFDLAKSNGILEKELAASHGLFLNYRALNIYDEALKWHESYVLLKDSVYNDSKSRELGRLESKHEYDSKAAALLAEQNQERLLADVERRGQKRILIMVSIGLGLVFILLVFLFNRFRLIKKQKKTIEHHKTQVEVKQQEIVDSITYAKRLQRAILTNEESILEFFPKSFLLYKPKDIVAGDFYFFETTDTHIFYAAADCTGHGVPGAMVSIICSNALTRSIKEFGISEPGKILDKTKELVVETFQKSGTDVKDGMDISLISKHRVTNEIYWSGAHNPLWIVDDNELIEIKADKQPIGKSEKSTPFKTHVVKAKVNSMLYLITDGYADQFGGVKGKKFKTAQFKALLMDCNQQSVAEQKTLLNSKFQNWKGNLEQLDDVCIIGVRV